MSPIASWRRLSQAGLDLRSPFVAVGREVDFNESPVHLFRRADDDGSAGTPAMPMMAEVAVLIVCLVLLLGLLMGIAWWFRRSRNKTTPPKTPVSPRRRLSIQEKKLKIQTLPKIRIEPPPSSDGVTVTVGSEDTDEMTEVHAPEPVMLRRPVVPTIITESQSSSRLASPGGLGSHPSPVSISRAAALPSFYSVSGDPPHSAANRHDDPFADPPSDGSDEDGRLSPVPL